MASDLRLGQITSILSCRNIPDPKNSNGYRISLEKPRALELQNEDPQYPLSDETSSRENSPKVEMEWTSDALRAFDSVWCDAGKSKIPNYLKPGTPSICSGTSSNIAISGSRQTSALGTYATLYRALTLEQSHSYWDTTKQLRLLPKANSRFYRPKILKEKLLGPENYKYWAEQMKKQFDKCGALWITDIDLEPVHSSLRIQCIHPDLNLWMMIFSNVSRPIRRELSSLEILDAREAWQFLERTRGRVVPMKLRSVKGLRDIIDIKYDDCTSLRDYIERMVLCSRAIQCDRGENLDDDGGKDGRSGFFRDAKNLEHRTGDLDNEWLWCQFILVNLGPKWESWVSELVGTFEDGQRMNAAISTFSGLFPIIEAEEARRVQVSRYTKHLSV